jgi:hypothetical protein
MENFKGLSNFLSNTKYLKSIVLLLVILIAVILITTLIAHWKIFMFIGVVVGLIYVYKRYFVKEKNN